MENQIVLSRPEKENVLRMLDGCICRICVSDDEHEIVRLIGSANHYLSQLGCNNISRIRRERSDKEV